MGCAVPPTAERRPDRARFSAALYPPPACQPKLRRALSRRRQDTGALMGRVQSLRAAPEPAQPRSLERQALALAIERHAAAERTAEALIAADENRYHAIGEAERDVEKANELVQQAKADATDFIVASALG